jgi:hypothetical protein
VGHLTGGVQLVQGEHAASTRLETIAVNVASRPIAVRFLSAIATLQGQLPNWWRRWVRSTKRATAHQILVLLSGDVDQRQSAALVAFRRSRPEDVGVLAALAQDLELKVRATAAAALAFLVAADRGGPVAASALQRCLHDPGRSVPLSIADALDIAPARSYAAHEALAVLRGHGSASVRAKAISAASR